MRAQSHRDRIAYIVRALEARVIYGMAASQRVLRFVYSQIMGKLRAILRSGSTPENTKMEGRHARWLACILATSSDWWGWHPPPSSFLDLLWRLISTKMTRISRHYVVSKPKARCRVRFSPKPQSIIACHASCRSATIMYLPDLVPAP